MRENPSNQIKYLRALGQVPESQALTDPAPPLEIPHDHPRTQPSIPH